MCAGASVLAVVIGAKVGMVFGFVRLRMVRTSKVWGSEPIECATSYSTIVVSLEKFFASCPLMLSSFETVAIDIGFLCQCQRKVGLSSQPLDRTVKDLGPIKLGDYSYANDLIALIARSFCKYRPAQFEGASLVLARTFGSTSREWSAEGVGGGPVESYSDRFDSGRDAHGTGAGATAPRWR
jgi:hypothetical protein